MLFHGNDYKCNHMDKLIDIQARIIDDNILCDYARYIICAVDSICSKKEEPRHFFENKRHRCRTYQLYVMLENIFGYLLPPMNVFLNESYSNLFKLIDNSIQIFYTPSEMFINASDHEMHILQMLITPRVNLMREVIQIGTPSDLIKLKCDAYHVEGQLELIINKKIYEKAIDKICLTYQKFI